jgi:glycosyltransferase involved in cell wall biosynthesis
MDLLFHSIRYRILSISDRITARIQDVSRQFRNCRLQITRSFIDLPKRLLRPYAQQLRMYAFFLPASSVGVAWNADVYHSHDFNTLNVGVVCSRLNHSRLVYDSHELYAERKLPEGRDENRERRYVLRREQNLIRKADAVITVSDIIADELSSRYKIKKPYIVMNCAKDVIATQSREERWIRDLVPKGLSSLILLYIGGITFGRGLEQAIQSLVYLNEAALVMVGPDRRRFREGLYRYADEIDVSDRVFYHSPIYYEKIPLLCREATVGLVLTQNISLNNYYGLPNKLFEYLSGGLPVVASDFPAIREIIEDSRAGVLCNPSDPVSISDAVIEVTRSAEKYRNYAANAQVAFADRYNWNRQAKILLDVYSGMAS